MISDIAFRSSEIGPIPNDWQIVRQKEVAQFINGRAYAYEEFKNAGTPIVRIQNLNGGEEFVYSDLVLDDEKYVEAGDLIYAWSGSFGPYLWNGPKAIFHYHIWKIICDEKKLDKVFFFYKLKHISDSISNSGTGSIFTHITKKLMEESRISLPPITEQKMISHILYSLDSKININHQINKILQEICERIFQHWFVEFEFPNEEDQSYGSSGGEMIDSELGKIPKGWKVGRIADVAENYAEVIDPAELSSDTPYVGLEHIPRTNLTMVDTGFSTDVKSAKFRFCKRDILFGKLRPYFHKVALANEDGVCSTDIIVIRPRNQMWYTFALMHLSSDDLIKYADSVSTGTKMPRTNWSDAKDKLVRHIRLQDSSSTRKNSLTFPEIV